MTRFFPKKSGIQKVHKNIWVLKLYNPLPLQEILLRKRIRAVKWINGRACLYQIKEALKYFFNGMKLLWAYYTPRTAFLLNKLRSDFIVRDVYDI